MVLADRSNDDGRNGRRSRGSSPNGHFSEESSDDEREGDGGMRVGRDFQAIIPDYIPILDRRPEHCLERALLVWSPTSDIPDIKLDDFIQLSKEKYGYNAEQALGMLFWHKHDLEKAILDLSNFTPFPDEWTVEDKVLFEQAFQFHGKSFHRIRQMLPDKSIASLVKYYYSWKKTRTRTSLMDRQARKLASQREEGSEGGSEMGSNSDSENEEKHDGKWTIHRGIRRECGSPQSVKSEEKEGESTKISCCNCGINCSQSHPTPRGSLCGTCHQYFRRTGMMRPTTGPMKRDGSGRERHHYAILRNKRKPPRGMYINHEDLSSMALGPLVQGEHMLKAMDREVISLKRQVQNNKQLISAIKRKTSEGIDQWRGPESNIRINARWTNDELLLAVQGVRKYGKDFKAIAEVIGTKSEAHLRSFFVNYRRRYNLDAVLKEYEAENGPIKNDDKDGGKMETDVPSSGSEASTPTPGGVSPVTVTTTPPPLVNKLPVSQSVSNKSSMIPQVAK